MNLRPRARSAPALAASALLCGCTSAPPTHNAEPTIVEAVGLSTPLVFRTEAGPLDEPDAAGDTLTQAEAVRRAVVSDAGLQAALARVRVSLADADQARLLPNPILNIIFKFPDGGGRPNIEAELSADIVSILRIPRKSSAADNRLRAACAGALTAALDVAAETQERYAAVQALGELMPVLEERLRLLGRLLQLAHDRLEAGEGTRTDATTLEAQRVQLSIEIAEKRRELRDERLRLTRQIGQPSGEAAWSLDPWCPPRPTTADEAGWVVAALVNRPEVLEIAWELAALGDDLALVRFAPFDGATAGVKADRDDTWAVGPSVAVPIPVFDLGQARRARVSAQQIEARHRLLEARRRVVEDVRRAYQSFAATRANLDRVRSELIPLLDQRRSQAEDAYRAGLTDVTALFLAEQDLQSSLAKRVELEQATAVSLVRLERAVGGAGVAAKLNSQPAPEVPSTPEPTRNGNEAGHRRPAPEIVE